MALKVKNPTPVPQKAAGQGWGTSSTRQAKKAAGYIRGGLALRTDLAIDGGRTCIVTYNSVICTVSI